MAYVELHTRVDHHGEEEGSWRRDRFRENFNEGQTECSPRTQKERHLGIMS